MKSKKSLFYFCMLALAAVAAFASAVLLSIARVPTVTEHEFNFSITYELNGEIITINDVYTAYYVGNGGYADTKSRIFNGSLKGKPEGDTEYIIAEDENGKLIIETKMYAKYLMGDPDNGYFEDEAFEPLLLYYDNAGMVYEDKETLASKNANLISWDYPTPIENTFVFSHISIFSGEIVLPVSLIGILFLLLTIILVKKENSLVPKIVNIISIILNYINGFVAVPFITFAAIICDISGSNDNILFQVLYFVPVIAILCIAVSVYLRRKGFGKSSLMVQFVGPLLFSLAVILSNFI